MAACCKLSGGLCSSLGAPDPGLVREPPGAFTHPVVQHVLQGCPEHAQKFDSSTACQARAGVETACWAFQRLIVCTSTNGGGAQHSVLSDQVETFVVCVLWGEGGKAAHSAAVAGCSYSDASLQGMLARCLRCFSMKVVLLIWCACAEGFSHTFVELQLQSTCAGVAG